MKSRGKKTIFHFLLLESFIPSYYEGEYCTFTSHLFNDLVSMQITYCISVLDYIKLFLLTLRFIFQETDSVIRCWIIGKIPYRRWLYDFRPFFSFLNSFIHLKFRSHNYYIKIRTEFFWNVPLLTIFHRWPSSSSIDFNLTLYWRPLAQS